MKVFLIICAVIALIDVVAVGAIMKNSSRISRAEETARLERLSAKECNKMATCKECVHYELCSGRDMQLINHNSWELADNVELECMHFQDTSKLIKLPCRIGDYFEWDNGVGELFYFEIIGFEFNTKDQVVRYITNGVLSPIVSHIAIRRIVTKEEAEKALKEREPE